MLITLGFLVAGAATFTIVDRFVPAPPPSKPAVEKTAGEKPAVEKTAGEKAPGDKPATEKPKKELLRGEAPGFTSGALMVTGSVLAGAVALLFVLKRVLKGTRHVSAGKRLLRVDDVLALGPKRAIYLIGLEGRNLVVALSNDQLTLLSEYSAEPELEAEQDKPATREGRTGELAVARPVITASPILTRPEAVPETLDLTAGEEIAVPPPEAPAPAAAAAPGMARAFSFAAVKSDAKSSKSQPGRVPLKFRQLLEQAAASEGASR